ncbi:MAG: type II toxin-antitoxin system VapC family toxin [Flavitalea sp.]
MKYFFLDTNVVIDVLANRHPHVGYSSRLFDLAAKGKITLYISSLSYSNIYYIIKKSTSHKEIIKILEGLEAITETLDVTRSVIAKSLKGEFKDFEDSIQYYTALSNKKINAIVTRDIKGFRNSELPIFNPEEALTILEGKSL